MSLRKCLLKISFIGFLSVLVTSFSVTRPRYSMANQPVEKPSCAELILPLKRVSKECINLIAPALACMYKREKAADAYVETLIKALKQVNR